MKRLLSCALLCACSSPKLTFKIDEKGTSTEQPARFDDVNNVAPTLAVTGVPEGDYSRAVTQQLKRQAGKIKITLDKVPEKSKGTFDTSVSVQALWWSLPRVTSAHAELVISIDYNKQSPSALGKTVGELVERYLDKTSPPDAAVPVAAASPATSVAVGTNLACSLHADKSLHCWSVTTDKHVGYVPSKYPLDNAAEIAAGDRAVCARLGDGSVSCITKLGQAADRFDLMKVCGVEKATQIAVGVHTGCAIVDGGKVKCWDTDLANARACQPVLTQLDAQAIAGVEGATQIAVGYWGACALVAGGKTTCWEHGQTTAKPTTLPAATQVAIGFEPCVLETSGQIKCDTAPKGDPGLVEAKIPAGSKLLFDPVYACAIEPDAKLECWGENGDGKVGDGTTTSSSVPRPILENVISADIALFGGCAVTKDGAVLCHGSSSYPTGLDGEHQTPAKLTIF